MTFFSSPQFVVLVGILAALAAVAAAIVVGDSRRSRMVARLDPASFEDQPKHAAAAAAIETFRQRVSRRLASVGDRLPMFSEEQRARLALAVECAGIYQPRAVSVLVGGKVFVGAAFAVTMLFYVRQVPLLGDHLIGRMVLVGACLLIGMLLPEFALGLYTRRRRRQMVAYLPDVLDLLVICTNAGNGLSSSLRRVALEMRQICPALAQEVELTVNEMQLSGDTATALRNFARRVDVPVVRSLVSTLVQSLSYGTPLTHALNVLARAERTASLARLEEKAAKLSPKMTVLMMLFILPSVMLIAAGPAVMRLMETLHGSLHGGIIQ